MIHCGERKVFERKKIIARLLVFYLLYNFLDSDNQLMTRGADTGTLCNPLGRLGRVAYISMTIKNILRIYQVEIHLKRKIDIKVCISNCMLFNLKIKVDSFVFLLFSRNISESYLRVGNVLCLPVSISCDMMILLARPSGFVSYDIIIFLAPSNEARPPCDLDGCC